MSVTPVQRCGVGATSDNVVQPVTNRHIVLVSPEVHALECGRSRRNARDQPLTARLAISRHTPPVELAAANCQDLEHGGLAAVVVHQYSRISRSGRFLRRYSTSSRSTRVRSASGRHDLFPSMPRPRPYSTRPRDRCSPFVQCCQTTKPPWSVLVIPCRYGSYTAAR